MNRFFTFSCINGFLLCLQPIELDVLKKDMKEAGIKCGMDKLMEFLDERVCLSQILLHCTALK